MLKRIFVMVAVTAAMSAIAGPQEAVTLKLNLKEGQAFTSKLTAQLEVQGSPVDVSGTSVSTVKSVKDGVFVMISETKGLTISFAGQTIEQPDETMTLTQSANGKILKAEGNMVTEESNRLQNAFNFFYPEKPVKVGDKWESTIAADKAMGTPEIKANYSVVERKEWKGKDVLVLKVAQTEVGTDPISLDGTFAIEIKTGIPVMSDFAFKNVPQMGMLLNGTWKTEVVE